MLWLTTLSATTLALIASLFTYSMTAAGAATVLLSKKCSSRALEFFNALAAGVMIAASFFSLLRPAIDSFHATPLSVVVGLIAGGGFLLLSDLLWDRLKPRSLRKRSSLFYAAVTLHNVPEGLAVGVAFAACGSDPALLVSALSFAFGIGVQNFPEGACVSFSLYREGLSRGRSFFLSQLSGAVEILFALVGAFLLSTSTAALPWVLSFSAGAMLLVTCSELVPESFSAEKELSSFGFLCGFAWMTLLDLAL